MTQEPEEQPTVFRKTTPEDFCATFNRAVAHGPELWTTNLGKFFRSQGMKNDLAGLDDDLAEQALDAPQESSLLIESDRPGEPHWLSREDPR
jgi:hypothetical protein